MNNQSDVLLGNEIVLEADELVYPCSQNDENFRNGDGDEPFVDVVGLDEMVVAGDIAFVLHNLVLF
jgi:hypothetical protein